MWYKEEGILIVSRNLKTETFNESNKIFSAYAKIKHIIGVWEFLSSGSE